VFKDEAMEILLNSLSFQENDRLQELAATFLSNLEGTYTTVWLSKKAGHQHPIEIQ
jgi:hypothetical protein